MSAVIDMKTRTAWQIEPAHAPRQPTDADRVNALLQHCEDAVYAAATTTRSAAGLDAALRMLHRIADDIKNHGRVT